MHKSFVIIAFVFVMLFSSCARPVTYTTTHDGVSVSLTATTAFIANQSIPVTVSFARAGAPYAVRDVAVALEMPGMTMGSSVPLATENSDGTHSVRLLFTMDGEWALVVTGTSERGAERFVITPVIVAP